MEVVGAFFHVLGVLRTELDKTYRRGCDGAPLSKAEKMFALQSEGGCEKAYCGPEAKGKGSLVSKIPEFSLFYVNKALEMSPSETLHGVIP